MSKILVTGASGQLGSELTLALRERHGQHNVIASDLKTPQGVLANGPFELLDVLDAAALTHVVDKYAIDQIYHLAAILSATGEKKPHLAWDTNMNSLLNVLELARNKKLQKIYWPSSIAVFGPHTPQKHTPQHCVMDPTTVYGISKLAGERWCEYYFGKHGVDVRSLRYPGLIGYKAKPGGGTTDYAVDIFYKALEDGTFESFLSEDTYLPMMYMDDAIKATIELMEADSSSIKVRSSYNIAAISFSPKEIAAEIKRHLPNFRIRYQPDYRQAIADSWPDSVDDTEARVQWGWQHAYGLPKMTTTILRELKPLLDHEAR